MAGPMMKTIRQAAVEAADAYRHISGLDDLSLELDVRVLTSDLSSSDGVIDGLVMSEGGTKTLVLNCDIPLSRRERTWAHLLGHVVERSLFRPGNTEYSFTEIAGARRRDAHEAFAETFARSWLGVTLTG